MPTLKKVLIIGDDAISFFICDNLIRDHQFADNVVKASNGLIALHYLKNCLLCELPLPELILLELEMPIMSGQEFLLGWKTVIYAQPKPSIYILTASLPSWERKQSYHTDQVAGYFPKPLTEQHLIEISTRLAANLSQETES